MDETCWICHFHSAQPCWHINQCQSTECGVKPRNNVLFNTNSVCVCSSLLFPYRLINKKKKKITESVNLMWASAPAVAALFWCLWKFCLDGNRLMHKCFSEWLHGWKNKHQRWWYTRMIEQSGLDTQALKLILDVLIIRKSLVKCVLLKSVTSNAISYSF